MISCIRTCCTEPVVAGLAVQPPRREAWIVEWPEDAFLLSPMCQRHADAVSVPAGWLLHDDRGDDSALFADRSVARVKADATVTRLDLRRARRQPHVETLTLFETPSEPPSQPGAAPTPEPQTANKNSSGGWIGNPDERHTDLLEVDAETPLLARAFRSSQAS